jgi:hypothetical protein
MLNPRGTRAYEKRVATSSLDTLSCPDQRQSAAEVPTISTGSINPAMNLVRKYEDLVVPGGTPIVTGRGALPSRE